MVHSHQVPHTQHAIKVLSHGVMLQCHKECVEHNADSDGKVQERIHHHGLY